MLTLPADHARQRLLTHQHLHAPLPQRGSEGARALLQHLRMIQLDPLDPLGTNAELVAWARVDGLARHQVYDALLPGHAFEHFAKERCLLPAEVFPTWRDHAAGRRRVQTATRRSKLPEGVLAAVLDEVRSRGPITARELQDRGAVEQLDWSGWKSTGKATSMALAVLWREGAVVICGREPSGKRYDVPERALPHVAHQPSIPFDPLALHERVRAAGLLPRATGPWWSMLTETRASGLVDRAIADGHLDEVKIEGSRRTFLTEPGWADGPIAPPDDRLRILAPLDPLLWDRKLVEQLFGFRYVWEVYKPAATREWGWYVVPLLHRGQLVGRLEGRRCGDVLQIDNVWAEPGRQLDEVALDHALERHAEALGLSEVVRPRSLPDGAATDGAPRTSTTL